MTALLILCGAAILRAPLVLSADENVTSFVVTTGLRCSTDMKATTWAGSWIAAVCVAGAVAVLTWWRRAPPGAVVAVVALWIGELSAVTVTKSVVERPLPPPEIRLVVAHGWSFPSGHTANAVVVFTVAAIVITKLLTRRAVPVVTWTLAILSIALVAFSRLEVGVHWATDVTASALWTTSWLVVINTALRQKQT